MPGEPLDRHAQGSVANPSSTLQSKCGDALLRPLDAPRLLAPQSLFFRLRSSPTQSSPILYFCRPFSSTHDPSADAVSTSKAWSKSGCSRRKSNSTRLPIVPSCHELLFKCRKRKLLASRAPTVTNWF